MIARHWTGLYKRERAEEYIAHLENDTFKQLTSIKGFLKAAILKRDTAEGVEFLITTHWDSIEAIKEFAGADVDTAIVPELVQDIMIRYDPKVRHYHIHSVVDAS
jgi:heme-degrading monooxygenase HmoA